MQTIPFDGHSLADIPPAFFPEEAMEAPALTRSVATQAPLTIAQPTKAIGSAPSRALKIVRAKSGETELRLLAEQDGNGGVHFIIASSTIAPYEVKRDLLVKRGKKKVPMNKQQAIEEFDLRVAQAYPPEKLRNDKLVAIHLNIL